MQGIVDWQVSLRAVENAGHRFFPDVLFERAPQFIDVGSAAEEAKDVQRDAKKPA